MPLREHVCRTLIAMSMASWAFSGCAAYKWHAVPARCVKPALPEQPRGSKEPINFIRLRQDPPPVYMLGARDILGIYIEGVLGKADEAPPVHFAEKSDLPPALGFPVPIREDGTLALPLVPPLELAGLSMAQAEDLIRRAYTVDRKILQPGRDRIIVTLIKPRTYSVLVVREDTSTVGFAGGQGPGGKNQILGSTKRGATQLVELKAYENDVLHALSESGGLPGLDAKNELKILRGAFQDAEQRDRLIGTVVDPMERNDVFRNNPNIITIPLRSSPDEPTVHLTQNDIILNTGDIVFIESREAEVFYTGGLLTGGQFPIPRDYDLDVLGAIAMAGGSAAPAAWSGGGQGRGAGGMSGGSGSLSGIIPPSRAIVVRTVNGQQFTIKVDLKKALANTNERILIQPNDLITLEYTESELLMNVALGMFQINYFLNGRSGGM
jgi:protein involved in polysaccharide export with SLBB domain